MSLGLYIVASLALIATPGQDMIYVITRSLAQVTLIPFGTIATLALFALIMRRAAGWPAIEPLGPATLARRESSSR